MRTRFTWLPVLVVGSALVLAGAPPRAAIGGDESGKEPKASDEKPKPFKVGEVVKGVSVEKLDGGTWMPADAAGKVAVVYFAGKDGIATMRKLNDLAKDRSDKVAVLGVFVSLTADKAKEAVKEEKEKIETPLGVDPEKKAVERFAKDATTEVVILGLDTKLEFSNASYDEKAVEKKIDALLKAAEDAKKAKDPDPPQPK